LLIFDKEALRNSLVHYNDSDLWFGRNLVVKQIDCGFELWNLTCKDLITLGITNTISENDEVSWVLIVVMRGKDLDRLQN